MALLIRKDGTKELHTKPEDEARLYKVWQVLAGRAVPDSPELARFCDGVQKVILNWRTAPEEYVRARLNEIVPQVIASWVVDRNGNPLRPATKQQYEFARKYGLVKGYKPTNLVTKRQAVLL
jgi:hypothetical protein